MSTHIQVLPRCSLTQSNRSLTTSPMRRPQRTWIDQMSAKPPSCGSRSSRSLMFAGLLSSRSTGSLKGRGFLCDSAPPNGSVTMNSRGSCAIAAAPLSIAWRITRRTAFIVRAYVVGVANGGEPSALKTPRTGWWFVTHRVKSATNSLAVASASPGASMSVAVRQVGTQGDERAPDLLERVCAARAARPVENLGQVVPGQITEPALRDRGQVECGATPREPITPVAWVQVAHVACVRSRAMHRFDILAHLAHDAVHMIGLRRPRAIVRIELEHGSHVGFCAGLD